MTSVDIVERLTNTVEVLHQYLVSEIKNIRIDVVTNNESHDYLIKQLESISKEQAHINTENNINK